MKNGAKINLFLAVFCISAAVLISQITLSAVLGFLYLNDFRLLLSSFAVLGLGLGGIAVFVFYSKIFNKASTVIFLANILFVITTVLPFFLINFVRVSSSFPLNQSTNYNYNQILLLVISLVSIINYFFAGIILSLSYSLKNTQYFKLYFFDLAGAALGSIALIFLIDRFGVFAPVKLSVLIALLGIYFFWTFFQKKTSIIKSIFALLLVFSLVFATFIIPFRINCQFSGQSPIAEKSNSLSYVQLYKYQEDLKSTYFVIIYNCSFRTNGYITKDIKSLKNKLDNYRLLPFLINKNDKVLILGSGAGENVSAALLTGNKEITAVEINPLMIDLTNSFPSSLGSSPYNDQHVKTIISEARTYISRTKEKYNSIFISYVEGNYRKPLGSSLFVPRYMYTVQSFEKYMERLNNDGYLFVLDYKPFLERYKKTLAAYLLEKKINPQKYLLSISINDSPNGEELMIYKKSPLTKNEELLILNLINKYNLKSVNSNFKNIKSNDVLTDDKPYLFSSATNSLLRNNRILIVVSILLLVFMFILFLKNHQNLSFPIYFIGISIGLSALEFVLINNFTLILGNPVYAHAISLTAILLLGGLGSLLFSKLKNKSISLSAILIAVLMIGYDYFSRNVTESIIIIIIISVFMSLLSGIFFPYGLDHIGSYNNKLVVWGWAFDTIAFVTCYLIISYLVFSMGIRNMMLIGAAGYFLALISTKYS